MLDNRIAFAIIEYLEKYSKKLTPEQSESLDVAIQCISTAFKIDPENEEEKKQFSILPMTLPKLFLEHLDKREPTNASNEKKAEELKALGNEKMNQKLFTEALSLYTQAINLNPMNAVYYCNRAAVYANLDNHKDAIVDCKRAIELDSTYSKAYSRLGHSQYQLGDLIDAFESYRTASNVDPSNQQFRQSMAKIEAELRERGDFPEEYNNPKSPVTSAQSQPAKSPSGIPDIGAMMNDPNFMSMAQNLMNSGALSGILDNPDFANMAKNFMGKRN